MLILTLKRSNSIFLAGPVNLDEINENGENEIAVAGPLNLDENDENIENELAVAGPVNLDGNSENGLAVAVAAHGGMVMAESRVVNGNSTNIEQFPWIVSMQYYGSHRCGGSIITTSRILTAAHCTVNISPSSLSIRAGSTDSQTGGQLIAVARYTNHALYNPTTLENDISVMVLESPLNTEPATVSIIPLPMQGAAVSTGITANVAGWGALCEKCPGITTLQYVGLPVLSNRDCNLMYGDAITAGMLCAGFIEGGRDACQV